MNVAPVNVLFMGRLRALAGAGARDVVISESTSLSRLRVLVAGDDAMLEEALDDPVVRVAINATLTPHGSDAAVAPGDEVAFMPPFSGG